jgi:hypothetical protein
MELTQHQIDFICKDLAERGLTSKHILQEILDHVCSDVEVKMRSGEDFDSSYKKTIENFGKENLKNLATDIKKAKELFIFADENFPPINTVFRKRDAEFQLISWHRNKHFVFILTILLSSASLFTYLLFDQHFPLFIVLLGVVLYLFVLLLFNIFGKTEISIDNNQLKIFEGIYFCNTKESLFRHDIKKIYLQTGTRDMALKGATMTSSIEKIAISGKKKITFGKSLLPEQKHFIIHVLKKYV